jgi:glutamate 5-kinase
VLDDKIAHTYFVPNRSASGKKKWIAHAGNFAKGVVQVNAGARAALTSAKASSLLPVGVINIITGFKKGEIIKLVDENNKPIGLGIAEYGSEKAEEMMGQKNQKALIHYDYLYLEC